MKNNTLLWLLLFSTNLLMNTGCKKDPLLTSNNTGNSTGNSTGNNTDNNKRPVVNAGADTTIEIPKNYVFLSAATSDDHGITQYQWEKISGPTSLHLEQGGSAAKALWLEEGVYEFEFTATDKMGLFGKDTIKIAVTTQLRKHILNGLKPGSSGFTEIELPEDILKNIKWVYCRSSTRCEQADNGPLPDIDYDWGGWFYNILAGNKLSVFGGYANETFDLIVYY